MALSNADHDLESRSADTRTTDEGYDRSGVRGGLEAYERDREDKPPFYLTSTELKLLGISGVGFFLDAYDLFIINQVTVMLQYRLYGGNSLPAGLEGFVKAGANIGSVIGQFAFGYAADAWGRKVVYGKELMIIIFATILCICAPTGALVRAGNPNGVLIWIAVFRIILGIGVGGDYPMSASVASDRTSVRKRGTMLAYVFANQGWGSLVGSLATMIVLAAYRHVMNDEGKISRTDGAWRIIVGISLIPAFGTLYQRLTLPESRRYVKAQKERADRAGADKILAEKELEKEKEKEAQAAVHTVGSETDSEPAVVKGKGTKKAVVDKKAHFAEFLHYFSEWRHAKILIGTCTCWFLLDIAFYGINLNQSVVLQEIGFGGKTGTSWHKLWETALGNLIITALGFVPGYYVTVLTIEYLGRKWIQIQGFLMAALFLGILAGKFNDLSTPAFVVCFALLQFFFNFGANATTYVYPAEVFPTRFRASAHGISAAAGKAGAIISSLAFNTLAKSIGTPAVLWIFFGCCIVGAVFSLLLPEVKGRDPDLIDAAEMREALAKGREH